MKKIYFIVSLILLMSILILFNNYERIKSAENDISEIRKSVDSIKSAIENYDVVKELYDEFVGISEKFVEYHTTGNISGLEEIVSNDVKILEEDEKIYGRINIYGENVDWILYDKESKEKYSHMEIQGYGYLDESEVVLVHIREYYYYEDGSDVTPPTFLNLFLKNINDKWVISGFEFDV